jgi:endonuclease III
MASKGGGPRQPLSQRRPKVAATRGTAAGKAGAKSTKKPTKPAKGGAGRGARPAKAIPRATAGGRAPARSTRRPAVDAAALAPEYYRRLTALYPDAHCELDFRSPFELLVATILSAQCTDRRVNMVTPVLFARYPNPTALAAARQEDVEEIIKSTGFFRNKAKSLIAMANAVVDRHGGEIPSTMDELVVLPGVGRKTANVILGNAFAKNEGVVVDTHVGRLAIRLGLTTETDAVKVEQGLMPLFPRDDWAMLSHLLIWHGRRVCDAKKPRCGECTLAEVCPKIGVAV